jgi:hypothetical protein
MTGFPFEHLGLNKKDVLPGILFYIRAGKVVLGTTLLATGVIVGGVYYANIDSKFRQTVEDNVPYASSLFNSVLGKSEPKSKTPPKKAPVGVSVCFSFLGKIFKTRSDGKICVCQIILVQKT